MAVTGIHVARRARILTDVDIAGDEFHYFANPAALA